MTPLDGSVLPPGIRARFVAAGGLVTHVLEAGEEGRPCVLLLHGFPELAYSWRKVMPALAAAGYHVVAPDQRGYGRTTGWDGGYDGDLAPFTLLSLARDCLGLVAALGLRSVAAVVGHDFGSPVAASCALARPDVFPAVALMSAPFAGPPRALGAASSAVAEIGDALAALEPPRKHYQHYYSSREADDDMRRCPQGLHTFLRAYYHMKSADWPRNKPFRLKAWTADQLALLPTYYVMELHETMPSAVAREAPSAAAPWLTDAELGVYAEEFARTGFQGGLQWYRCGINGLSAAELRLFSGRAIEVPSCFIAGQADWGVYQAPGAIEAMQSDACTRMEFAELVEGAGHWVQQEQPERVTALLLRFLGKVAAL